MRHTPFPATDDTLLLQMFGADRLAGRTLLCAGGGGTRHGDWVVAVVETAAGLHALEHLRRPDGRASVSDRRIACQSDWTDLVERALDPTMKQTIFFSVMDWMTAQLAVAATDPDWDEIAAMETWQNATKRIAAATNRLVGEAETGAAFGSPADLDPEAPPLDDRAREIRRAMAEFSEASPAGLRPN